MTTDQLGYEIFVADPGSFFEMIGEPPSEADHYKFHALDLKAVERRADGVFEPKDATRPYRFMELIFRKNESAYANLFVKVFLKLEQHPGRDWQGVMIFGSKRMLPTVETPYEDLFAGKRVKLVFLESIPEAEQTGFGVAILRLAVKPKTQVARDGRVLVQRLRSEVQNEQKRRKLAELVEFVVSSRLTECTLEEIQTMLGLDDFRKSRVYKQSFAEGKTEGKAEMLQETVARMAAKNLESKQIADFLGVDVKKVRRILNAMKK